MAEIARLEAQVEIKSPVMEFYGFFRNNMHHLVEMFPEQLKSFQLLDADEIRADSLTHWKYDLGSPMTAKVKIEDIDDEDMSTTFNVVEGDAFRFYKSFKVET
ncbi:hypothetical protein F2P56_021631 [Juglans regia]|uniref:Bet v I/Major latex protein domain-containing protein n=2 Tax=Juglans regia TaxID=51240 RepID=A0A833UAG0_JUGRE|nr:MLP-like protein 34 [Juglans regia]KAF5457534.1 hypothetical protein F2P56_021631 [Juglans regia]